MIRRCSFNTLSMLSVALLVGCAVLWVRSIDRSDAVNYRGDGGAIRLIMTVPHALRYQSLPASPSFFERLVARVPVGWSTRSTPWGRHSYQLTAGGLAVHVTEINSPPYFDNTGLGFGWRGRAGERTVTVPQWFLVTTFSILPVIRIRQLVRDRARRREGLCQKCGYDLRATPGRCPECGHVVGEDFYPAA